MCFELEQAKKLALDSEALPVVQAQLEHYRALTSIRESQVKSLEGANAAVVDAAAKATKAIQDTRAASSDPMVWFMVGGAIGAVVGAAVTIAIVEAVR